MVAAEAEYRPQATEILAALEDKRARSSSTIIFDRDKLPFPYGAFDWKDDIHQRLLHCSRVLVLLKGNRPTIESDALERKLAEIGIFGGRIRRLIGDFDFLVDVWVREDTRRLLNEVCLNFNLMTTHSSVEPKYYDIEAVLDVREAVDDISVGLVEKKENEFLKDIFEIVSKKSPAASLQKFKDRGYGAPFLIHDNAIEFIVQFESKGTLLPGAKTHYQKAIFEYGQRKIAELEESKLLNRFTVLTLKESSDFLVMFSVRRFVNFSHMMLGMMRELREQKSIKIIRFPLGPWLTLTGSPARRERTALYRCS